MGRASCAVPHDGVHAVLSLEPLQLHLALISERELAGALRQLLQQRRDQDLAARRLPSDARGKVHVLAEEVLALPDHLARVQADTDADRLGVKASIRSPFESLRTSGRCWLRSPFESLRVSGKRRRL